MIFLSRCNDTYKLIVLCVLMGCIYKLLHHPDLLIDWMNLQFSIVIYRSSVLLHEVAISNFYIFEMFFFSFF